MKTYITSALLLCFLCLPAHSAVINLSSTIDGAQANAGAGTGSSGTGSAAMTYDDGTGLFSWNINWSGLTGSAVAAHFHGPALSNQNAGVTVGIGVGSNPAIGSASITGLQAADLLAGLWYINIHTAANPGGEIRGQVSVVPIPAAAWLFISALGGLAALKRRKA